MRKTAFAGTAILITSLALAACGTEDPGGASMSEETSQAQTDGSQMQDETADGVPVAQTRSGDLKGLNDKIVDGSVEVSATEVVLSEFSSDQGPDLHMYLTNGSDAKAVAAGVEIDVVAFDEESQTFTLDGVDVADYDTVVIHCDKAKAVFGAAPIA